MATITSLPAASTPLIGSEVVAADQLVNGVLTTVKVPMSEINGGVSTPQSPNVVFAGPVSGSSALPTFRAISGLDLQFPAGTHFFSSNGAVIERLNDRVFIGGATFNDGAYPNVAQDWLTTFQVAAGLPNGSIAGSQAAVLTNSNSAAGFAFIGGAQSSVLTNAGDALGVSAFAINNNPNYQTSVWAFYGEAHAVEAIAPYTYAMELATRATVPQAAPGPYNASQTAGLLLSAGAGLSATGQFNPAVALWIQPDPMQFQAAIVIGADAVAGVSGNVGKAPAIQMAKGHQISWYSGVNSIIGSVLATATNSTDAGQINFENAGVAIQTEGGTSTSLLITTNSAAVNYLQIEPSVSGNAVILTAQGTDANIDLQLTPKGTGLLWLGPSTAATTPANFSATTRIQIKDAAGVTWYVPADATAW